MFLLTVPTTRRDYQSYKGLGINTRLANKLAAVLLALLAFSLIVVAITVTGLGEAANMALLLLLLAGVRYRAGAKDGRMR